MLTVTRVSGPETQREKCEQGQVSVLSSRARRTIYQPGEGLSDINDYELQRGLGFCTLRDGPVQFLAAVYSVGDQGHEVNPGLLFHRRVYRIRRSAERIPLVANQDCQKAEGTQ